MADFYSDLFSTASTADLVGGHTSDSGATYSLVKGSISPKVFTAAGGIVANGGSGIALALESVISPSSEIDSRSTFHYDSGTFQYVGRVARANSAGTTGYLYAYSGVSQKWAIWAITSAADPTLSAEIVASATTSVYVANAEPVVQFKAQTVTGAVNLTLIVDGVTLINAFADTSGSRPLAAGYEGVYFSVSAAAGSGMWITSAAAGAIATPATATTLSGPSSGAIGVASSNFTVGANGTISGTVVITPSDSGAGGSFTPTSVSISSGSPTGTFTYTPSSSGVKSISTTNNGSLTNPTAVSYTVATAAATATTLSGPSSGPVGSASSNFTVGANGAITGTVIITPSDSGGGGSFTPSTVSISNGSPTGAFTYTAATVGTKTISTTNNGSLTNPTAISYTAASGAMRTITIKLVDYVGASLANLTGIKWAVHAEKTPDLWGAPIAQGAAETTDGTGIEVITFSTALAAGTVVSLTLSNSDGTAATIHSAFCGPVDLT